MKFIQKNWLLVSLFIGLLLLVFRKRVSAALPVMSSIIPGVGGSGSTASFGVSYLGLTHLPDGRRAPRGMRNNNPGNIRVSSNTWKNKIPLSKNTDKAFEQFTGYLYGIRAFIKNLKTYYTRDGLKTVSQIIYKWAPPGDNNDTAGYVDFVVRKSGLPHNSPITFDEKTIGALVRAMAEMENGVTDAITQAQFSAAWKLV